MGLLDVFKTKKPRSAQESIEKAIEWAKLFNGPKGITISHKYKNVWPLSQETGGYLIASLYAHGEKKFAFELAEWETSMQQENGAFIAVDKIPYTFDTAQVIRGFLAIVDERPEFMPNLRRACDYVASKIDARGCVLHDTYATWLLPDGSTLSEFGNLYVLPPLLQAGIKLNEPRYVTAARCGMDYFRAKPDLVEFKPELATLSHYFGYMMEALAEMGETELAAKGLKQAEKIQRADGFIPAYPGVSWACSTGIAQLGIAWCMMGDRERAQRSFDYMRTLQNPTGGFYGGYGKGATYFPKDEISWAVKFFLDLAKLLEKNKK